MDTSKIIKGVVNSGRYTVTAPIVKEDYGLYLQIEGVELPSTYEVDFSNSEHNGTSVTMIGNADGVLIPRQFIDSGKDVFAFLYHVGADYGRTVYKFRIPNKVRPDRTNEEPTPEEQSVIDQAIGALNDAVAQTAQDVIDAAASAQSASQSAENAHDSAVDAQNYAETAQTSATQASASASQASASATASAQSASEAETARQATTSLAAEAQRYADASEQSATASANSAEQAQGYAQSASASAQSASGYASQAQSSANTASGKAEEASGYAQTASDKATESAQSASQALSYKTDAESAKTASQTAQGLAESARDTAVSAKTDAESASDDAETARDEAQQAVASISGALDDKAPIITDTTSGAIASFPDGANDLPLKSLIVDINPIQDLHGQDSPYPAGGGKNKLPLTVDGIKALNPNTRGTWTGNSYICRGITYTLVTDSDGNIIKIHVSGTRTGASYLDLAKINSIPNGTYIINGGVTGVFVRAYHFNGTNIASSAGADIQFTSTDEAGNNTFDVVTSVESEVNVDVFPMVRMATESDSTFSPYENLCPISGWTEVDVEQRGVNIWDEEWEVGRINPSTGGNHSQNDAVRSKNYIPCIQNTEYYYQIPSGKGNILICFYDADKSYVGLYDFTTVHTFITPANCCYMRFCTGANYGTTYNHDISINYPSTDHDYHPYQGQSITISLGQTVYGGKLDVLTGELVDGWGRCDLGALNWTYDSTYQRFMCDGFYALGPYRPANNDTVALMVCDKYATRTDNNTASAAYDNIIGLSGSRVLHIKDTSYNDKDAFKASLSGTYLVFKLLEPTTVQLTPNQINSLYGQNNIWADSGDTEVEYRADTKLFIAKKIAEAISALS